ncbi:MAG TPA: hypothetical protein EYG98_06670 [Sulfurovum sp.]|nr:hypothetical protein [Sulfurovum sp.]
MILYIHGFRTTIDSDKSKQLKFYFKDDIIIADYPSAPQDAIAYLSEMTEKEDITGIIASSLGGFYATYLGARYGLKTVLINPSVEPHNTTRKFLGKVDRMDGTTFPWEEKHLKELSLLWVNNLVTDDYCLFLKRGDVVLDYRVAEDRYAGAQMFIEDGGEHSFVDFDRYIKEAKEFLHI